MSTTSHTLADFFRGQISKLKDPPKTSKFYSDGILTPEEFIKAAVDKKLYSTEKMMKFAFNFFDTEKTGLITVEDIIELFKDSTDEDIDATKEFTKLISAVDLDSNGKIDFNEFSTFMTSLLEKL